MSKLPVPAEDKKNTSGKGLSTAKINGVVKLGTATINATKSFVDYKTSQEKTTQVYIESAQKVEASRASVQTAELQHIQAMRRLDVDEHKLVVDHASVVRGHDRDDRVLDQQGKLQDEVLDMLRDGKVTPEDAVKLLQRAK